MLCSKPWLVPIAVNLLRKCCTTVWPTQNFSSAKLLSYVTFRFSLCSDLVSFFSRLVYLGCCFVDVAWLCRPTMSTRCRFRKQTLCHLGTFRPEKTQQIKRDEQLSTDVGFVKMDKCKLRHKCDDNNGEWRLEDDHNDDDDGWMTCKSSIFRSLCARPA